MTEQQKQIEMLLVRLETEDWTDMETEASLAIVDTAIRGIHAALEEDNQHHAAIYLDIALANIRLCLDEVEGVT